MNHKFLFLFLVCIINLFHCVPRVLGTPVIGGSVDDGHRLKYHVSLHKISLRRRTYMYVCGGTIIHEKYVLTAAHCYMDKYDIVITKSISIMEERPIIIAGTNKKEGQNGIVREVVAIFIPNTYQLKPNRYGDIAVVQLRGNLGVARNRRTLQIMPIGELPPNEANKQATFCGFGRYHLERGLDGNLYYLPVYSDVNRFLTVTLLGESECPNFHSFICAVTSDNSDIRTGCLGDSGGGLIFENRIVGVLSYGSEDCNSNTVPNRFTRLSLFRPQVDRAMNESADHSDMHVLRGDSTPHQSPRYQAGPSSPHNEATPDRPKKGCFRLPKFLKKNLAKIDQKRFSELYALAGRAQQHTQL